MTSSAEGGRTETALRRLVARGFRFLHPRSAAGELMAVVGVRAHDDVIDVVALRAAEDAKATRMPAGEPDVLTPSRVLWEASGAAEEVLDQLLELADTDAGAGATKRQPTAAAAARGCWVPVRPGRSSWLMAS